MSKGHRNQLKMLLINKAGQCEQQNEQGSTGL